MIFDKNYDTVRENDKVKLDYEMAKIEVGIETETGKIKCTAYYEPNKIVLRDEDDNKYEFDIDPNGRANQLMCIEVIESKDEDTEYLI